MSGFRGSLEEQAAQLSKSIHNRERKRNAEKLNRQVGPRVRATGAIAAVLATLQRIRSHSMIFDAIIADARRGRW